MGLHTTLPVDSNHHSSIEDSNEHHLAMHTLQHR